MFIALTTFIFRRHNVNRLWELERFNLALRKMHSGPTRMAIDDFKLEDVLGVALYHWFSLFPGPHGLYTNEDLIRMYMDE